MHLPRLWKCFDLQIPLGLICGRITHVVWPPHRLGRVDGKNNILAEVQVDMLEEHRDWLFMVHTPANKCYTRRLGNGGLSFLRFYLFIYTHILLFIMIQSVAFYIWRPAPIRRTLSGSHFLCWDIKNLTQDWWFSCWQSLNDHAIVSISWLTS